MGTATWPSHHLPIVLLGTRYRRAAAAWEGDRRRGSASHPGVCRGAPPRPAPAPVAGCAVEKRDRRRLGEGMGSGPELCEHGVAVSGKRAYGRSRVRTLLHGLPSPRHRRGEGKGPGLSGPKRVVRWPGVAVARVMVCPRPKLQCRKQKGISRIDEKRTRPLT
jgi:hypothetical protein